MLTKIIVAIFTSLGVIFLWLRRRNVHYSTRAAQDATPAGNQDEQKAELDEAQAAEVITTWNILNPPS
jgi:hypothetical protein